MAKTEKQKKANEAGRDREFWKTARVGKELDGRRCKLTDEDKKNIKKLHKEGMAQRAIAREYADKCSRRTISFILFPERKKIVAEQYKERRKDGRYYNPEKHKLAIQNWRDKVRIIHNRPKIK